MESVIRSTSVHRLASPRGPALHVVVGAISFSREKQRRQRVAPRVSNGRRAVSACAPMQKSAQRGTPSSAIFAVGREGKARLAPGLVRQGQAYQRPARERTLQLRFAREARSQFGMDDWGGWPARLGPPQPLAAPPTR